MAELDWTSYGYHLVHPDDLEEQMKICQIQGFEYHSFDHLDFSPSFVDTPSRNRFTQRDIEIILSQKLEFGNKKQIEALRAAEFFQLAQAFYGDIDLWAVFHDSISSS